MFPLFFLLLFIVIINLPFGLFASVGNSAEISYYELALKELQYIKGASLVEEPFGDSPNPVTLITGEELKRFGWYNLRDLLEYQPSFYLVRDVNERVISHRGIYRTSTFHLYFQEDGLPLNVPGYRNFILDSSYPLLDVKRCRNSKRWGSKPLR